MRLRLPALKAPSIPTVITAVVVVVSMVFVFSQLQPHLLLTDTKTAGGDMGAHVATAQYLRDHLLPHWRVTGWTPDWYAGFPALHYYFPLPALITVVLDLFLPYDIAFKLTTVSGLITLPLAAWAFGRLARLPFPAPACLAAATLPYIFDTGYSILGGNAASTLAGEFSFSVGLSFAFVFLGLVAGGLETRSHRVWAGVLLGATILTHILPTLFALTGGTILFVMHLLSPGRSIGSAFVVLPAGPPAPAEGEAADDAKAGPTVFASARAYSPIPPHVPWKERLRAFWWAVPVAAFGMFLAGFWAVPFILRSAFMTDMGWEKIGNGTKSGMTLYGQDITNYSDALFPGKLHWLLLAALVSAAVALFLRRKITLFFVIVAVFWAIAFILMPQGTLWNARFLPFWYLALYLLAAMLLAEMGWGLAALVSKAKERSEHTLADIAEGMSLVTPLVTMAVALMIVMAGLPAPGWWPKSAVLWHDPNSSSTASFIPSWASWNYSGYQRKDAYPEFKGLIDAAYQVGKDNGCGRAMWEYEPELDRFGTPMSLMLLPTYTDGCIASMEGLFFESSATTPYHFLDQALLSKTPSSAMRNMPYGTLNVTEGVTKLQTLGVKYYLAVSPEAQAQAANDSRLTLRASVPAAAATDGTVRTWNMYEIAGSAIVAPVTNLPAVMTDQQSVSTDFKLGTLDPDPSIKSSEPGPDRKLNARDAWLGNSVTWYENSANFDVLLAASGPKNWPRVANANEQAPRVNAGTANVTMIVEGDDRIDFNVDKVGVPMEVKASYFPNWQVKGADGPYRVTPNTMVVIPTSNHVELHYGRTPVDWLGILTTFAGIVGLAYCGVHDARRRRAA